MKPIDPEELLWELGRAPEGEPKDGRRPAAQAPSEATLEAYRKGRLSEAETRQVEEWLGRDPSARRLLVDAAESAPEPPARLRQDVLAAYDEAMHGVVPFRPAQPRQATRRRLVVRAAWAAAAAASLVLGVRLLPHGTGAPLDLRYEVAVRGAALSRGVSAPSGAARAFASTIVRVEAAPEATGSPAVEVGLYRVQAGRLERLMPSAAVHVDEDRGTAVFAARAGDLVEPTAGVHDLYVVVGPRGALPPNLATAPADPTTFLSDGGRCRAYRRTLELLPATPGVEGAP
jgi:hypothetical protein